ncbi:helix-turn-helix transcriptional regulator [Natrononativus amylolyticus]|uniref:helix-turn-helix transcriptional regulator n=1 Tax=Natrononativus amylolyticus TaxID=2963434 RepID=UPI0020CC0A4E|nr:helix-turn-helix domain-containing protein [Natrononativus amylolyticus]
MESVRRAALLAELRSAPADAGDLEDSLDISRSTVHRATNTLLELNLLQQSNGKYELTGVGEFVADETQAYRNRVGSALSLEPFLNLVDVDDVPVQHFSEADVILPQPRQPHFSVRRIIELIQSSDTLGILSTVISPFYVDVAHREMLDGMEIEAVFDEEIIDIVLEEYEREALEAFETGRFHVHVHPDVPFELFLFDDRIGMAAHDENGIARVFVETDDPNAIDWASSLYERHLAESRPVAGTSD